MIAPGEWLEARSTWLAVTGQTRIDYLGVKITAMALAAFVLAQQPTALHNLLARTASEFPGKAGIWVKHLTTNETAGVRDGETFNSASVIKLPVLVLAFQMADKGAINLDERITIRKEDIRGGSGIFRYHDAGLQPTFRDVLLQMVITSDNTATDLAIAKVGGVARVNTWLKESGYADPSTSSGQAAMRLVQTTGELFAKYGDSLLNLAFRFLGARARSEELVQEAFLRVYRARDHYEPRARFRTYISRVVVNLCFNELRRAERQVITESLQDAPPESTGPPRDHPDPKAPSGEAKVAAGQIHRRVEAAISILPSKQKTALLLTKFDGYSYQQVAEVLDTTSDAVKALVARATRKLREELEDLID